MQPGQVQDLEYKVGCSGDTDRVLQHPGEGQTMCMGKERAVVGAIRGVTMEKVESHLLASLAVGILA